MLSRLTELPRLWRRVDPEVVDWAAGAVLLVALEVPVWSDPSPPDRLASGVFRVVGPLAVAVRRRWLLPMIILAAALAIPKAVIFGGRLDHHGGLPGLIVAFLLFYGAGAFLDGWRSWLAAVLGLFVVWTATVYAPGFHPTFVNLASTSLITIVVCVLPLFAGRIVRDRGAAARADRERAERLDVERDLRIRTATARERARLAREIHDVIAHSVSVMVIQAAGARTVMDRAPERAEASVASVERAGREALAEMRRLLGILDDGDRHVLAPQPGLDDLEDLVTRTTATGLRTSVSVEGEPVAVPPGVSLCAYRIVQEALTNTIKHCRCRARQNRGAMAARCARTRGRR